MYASPHFSAKIVNLKEERDQGNLGEPDGGFLYNLKIFNAYDFRSNSGV